MVCKRTAAKSANERKEGNVGFFSLSLSLVLSTSCCLLALPSYSFSSLTRALNNEKNPTRGQIRSDFCLAWHKRMFWNMSTAWKWMDWYRCFFLEQKVFCVKELLEDKHQLILFHLCPKGTAASEETHVLWIMKKPRRGGQIRSDFGLEKVEECWMHVLARDSWPS